MVGYGSVHFGKSLLWAGEDALALYILVRIVELPPALAGVMFLASSLWNALCDGLFGAALQRWPATGRFVPLLSALALLACGGAFAALPLVEKGDAAIAIALLFLFRTGFSLADLPHNALTRQLAQSRGDLGIARLRAAGASAAAIVVGLAAYLLLDSQGSGSSPAFALIGGIGLVAILFMAPLPLLLARDGRAAAPAPAPETKPAADRFLSLYCLATAIGLAGIAAIAKALLHLDFGAAELGAAVVLVMTVGRLAAVWLWSPVARRLGNRPALALAYATSGIAAPLLALLAPLGPAVAWPATILFALLGGGIAMLCWAVLSEALGRGGRQESPGRYAAAFGLFTMSMKVGLGLSAALTGAWLSASGAAAGLAPATLLPLALMATLASFAAALMILGADWRARPEPASAGG
nr:MFS transporter [Sandaracinobacteroides sayramensis]